MKYNLKDHVKGNVTFVYYRANHVYYVTDTGLEFPIPLEDVEGATLLAKDKAMLYMRWIKKYLDTIEKK